MAKLNILKDGDETLRKVSRPVERITERTLTLLDDMAETMRLANGCGLAGPQVGVLRRIVVIELPECGLIELINPEIVRASRKLQEDIEGCLSIPGKWGITNRPESVTVRALNRRGETIEIKGRDMLAKALCHELDHLDGILYTDVAKRMLTYEEVLELQKESE